MHISIASNKGLLQTSQQASSIALTLVNSLVCLLHKQRRWRTSGTAWHDKRWNSGRTAYSACAAAAEDAEAAAAAAAAAEAAAADFLVPTSCDAMVSSSL